MSDIKKPARLKLEDIAKRLADLEKQVAATPRRGKYLSCVERDLYDHAIAYAMAKLHRTITDGHGERVGVCQTEADEIAEHFLMRMKSDALAMVRELSVEERPK